MDRLTNAPQEARVPAGGPAPQGQTSTNADIVVQHGDERKAFLTLRAQAALLGFELIELGASTYLNRPGF